MTDRLTIAAARPGMRVDQQVLIAAQSMDDAQRSNPVWLWYSEDAVTFGRWQKRPNQAPYVRADLIPASDPTLAALLSERAPELLEAVRSLYERDKRVPRYALSDTNRALMKEIERAGLIAQEPRTTFHLTPQQFQEMWNVG